MFTRWIAVLGLTIGLSLAHAAEVPLKSPELHPDRRVTFRLKASNASAVKLWGDWITRFNTLESLDKNEAGMWSVTIGPLPPGKHSYVFLVDGLAIPDPTNAFISVGREGFEANLVNVPGGGPLVDDEGDVSHGAVHIHRYRSSFGLGERRFVVYTPPNYVVARSTRYPVLVLLHGSGSTETSWTNVGFANLIADNLLSEKRMRPMLIVMPYGWSSAPGAVDGQPAANAHLVEMDLLRDVLPTVASLYRVKHGRQYSAIAGASMGGYQALAFGLRQAERFGSIGVFSAGAHGPEGKKEVDDAAASGRLADIRLFWIGIGEKDPLPKDAKALDEALVQHNVPHQFIVAPNAGHTWLFWRQCLAVFLPQLFGDSKQLQPVR